MLSKEEIEKAKEKCNSIIEFCKNSKECQENKICSDCYIEIEDIKAIKTLLQYVKELEADNYEANNIINEYIEERRKILNKLHDVIDDNVYSDIEYSIRRGLAQELLEIMGGEHE